MNRLVAGGRVLAKRDWRTPSYGDINRDTRGATSSLGTPKPRPNNQCP